MKTTLSVHRGCQRLAIHVDLDPAGGEPAMADVRAQRIAAVIEPLRVAPGLTVNLAQDFDPGYTADFLKKHGTGLLKMGVALLADHRVRLAAQDPFGVLVCL